MALRGLSAAVMRAIDMVFEERNGDAKELASRCFLKTVVFRQFKGPYTKRARTVQLSSLFNQFQKKDVLVDVCNALLHRGASLSTVREYLDQFIIIYCRSGTKFMADLKNFVLELSEQLTEGGVDPWWPQNQPAPLDAPGNNAEPQEESVEMEADVEAEPDREDGADQMEADPQIQEDPNAKNDPMGAEAEVDADPDGLSKAQNDAQVNLWVPEIGGGIGAADHPVLAMLRLEIQDASTLCSEVIRLAPRRGISHSGISPKGLKVQLFPHQQYAVDWMISRERHTPGGGILVDEGYLGKCEVVMALIVKTLSEDSPQFDDKEINELVLSNSTLIVVTRDELHQWTNALKRLSDDFGFFVYEIENRKELPKQIKHKRIVLTGSDTLTRELACNRKDKKAGQLFQFKYERFVVDFAKLAVGDVVSTAALEIQALHRWAIIGTQDFDLLSALERDVRKEEIPKFNYYGRHVYSLFRQHVWDVCIVNDQAFGVDRLKDIVEFLMLRQHQVT